MVRMIVMMRKMKTFNGWVQTNCWQRCHLKRSTIWSPFIMNTQHCFHNLHEHSDFQAKKPQKNPLSRLVGGSLLTMEEDTAIGFARTVKSWLKSASRYHYQLYEYVSILSCLFFTAISPQATVLDFASDIQWVQYGEGGERVEFVANRTREGTFPLGSQWSRNPIPACIEPDGGYMQVLIFQDFPSKFLNLTCLQIFKLSIFSRTTWTVTREPSFPLQRLDFLATERIMLNQVP